MAEAQSPQGPADNAKAAVDPARVFISYASQDKGVAEAVCQAVEQAGMGCWIAPRDVVPGEAYSGAIVHAIDSTKATVLVLSESAAASPHVLREVERAISRRHPVVAFRIDLAPMPVDLEYFLNTSQWLDASTVGLERALPQLIAAVQRMLAPTPSAPCAPAGDALRPVTELSGARPAGASAGRGLRRTLIAMGALRGLVLGYATLDKLWLAKRKAVHKSVTARVPAAPAFIPPAHSIAVLPFVNMSGDKDQDYFSEGLTEELLNSLSRINQ
jgi:hypothetical protein